MMNDEPEPDEVNQDAEDDSMVGRPYDLKDRTTAFALRIIRLYSALPKEPVAQVLGKQVLRSGTAVGANYREANRGRARPEFIPKMSDCLKELDGTQYWLVMLRATRRF